jgi:anti-sigma B factor antagonist
VFHWQNDSSRSGFFIFLLPKVLPMPTETSPISLTVTVERKGDECVVVLCSGRLVSGVCSFFNNKIQGLIPDNKRIVLDLTNLEWVDSMGIGTLVRIYVACKRTGCQLELINLGKRVKEMLGLTNLLGIFGEMGERGINPFC